MSGTAAIARKMPCFRRVPTHRVLAAPRFVKAHLRVRLTEIVRRNASRSGRYARLKDSDSARCVERFVFLAQVRAQVHESSSVPLSQRSPKRRFPPLTLWVIERAVRSTARHAFMRQLNAGGSSA
jgi:hypothetical protein